MLQSVSFIFGLAVLFSLINYRWLKFPYAIGLVLISVVMVGLLYLLEPLVPNIFHGFCEVVSAADFEHLLFDVLLSPLLFAGALHIDIHKLAKERWSILLFASLGVLISTFLVGGSIKMLSTMMGIELPWIFCLLFGSLISPTDPIAVLSVLERAGIGQSLLLKIKGESLFNDGFGIVVFSGLLLFVPSLGMPGGEKIIASEIGLLFLKEVVGGLVFGGILGYVGFRLAESVCAKPTLPVLVSFAVVLAGAAVAHALHFSAPLAMVVCGLIIGNNLKVNDDMNSEAKELHNRVWKVLDKALNGLLFVLIGLAIHLLEFDTGFLLMGIMAIFPVLLIRFITVYSTYSLLKSPEAHPINTATILTWGGLHGGISIALALRLSSYPDGGGIILMAYMVVLFSILVQGLTMKKLVQALNKE